MPNIIEIAQAGVITDAKPISQVGISVLYFLLSVAGIIAIISLVVAGMKYFFALGDVKQMASAKKAAQYSIIGIIMAMSAMIGVNFIGQFFK